MTQLQPDFHTLPDIEFIDVDEAAEIPPAFADFLSAVRRHLHQHPELGFEERNTSGFLRRILERGGFTVHGPVAKTGLYVEVHGSKSGRAVAYRADIDALPTQDVKTVSYASRNSGVAHLCGHDAHSAIALGTALILKQNRERLRGTVRVFFQPNEEGVQGGATAMIREGVMDGMDAVYAVHVDPSLEVGTYGLLAGPVTAATDTFRVRIRADSTGHSARPHETVDTVWVATQVANMLYQVVGRVTDARNPSVLTICRFRGGDTYNVIPVEVEFGGTLRTTNLDDRRALLRYIQKAARTTASIYAAVADVDIHRGSPPVYNDPRLVEHLEVAIRAFLGDEAVFHMARPSMGAEDFAHYLEHAPGMLLRAGTFSGPATAYRLHDARFDIDERALAPTAVLMARVLKGHLEKSPLLPT